MIIIKTKNHIHNYLSTARFNGQSIGFVPTMGALHPGHISLIQNAKKEVDLVVCSIFINPTQFNNKEDLTLYPRTIESDIEKLVEGGCSVLFLPEHQEIYPWDFQPIEYDLGYLETILEGHHRPGHFQGVCQVVDQLLDIIPANKLYLGQKDYQQCLVIKKLLELTGKNEQVTIHIVSTSREPTGLAMSSRNMRLDQTQKDKAASIFAELKLIKSRLQQLSLKELKNIAVTNLEENGFVVDYVEIADLNTLTTATDKNTPLIALIAASLNNVRLIDNMILN